MVEAAERARRVPLVIASLVETVSTVQTFGRVHGLQANGAIIRGTQSGRFDDQAFPCRLLAWIEHLKEIALIHVLPFRRILLAVDLDAMESVLASPEPNCDRDNRVVSMAVGTDEGGLGQLDDAKILSTYHPMVRSTFALAFDVRSFTSGTSTRSKLGEPKLEDTFGIGDIRKLDRQSWTAASTP